jgi:broad specificity phosphatase PhoE
MPNGLATTVILIRHGERDELNPTSQDPHLNEVGKARAQTLIHVVGTSGIKAIYTSHFIRTKETAQPLAIHLSLSPIQMDEASNIRNDTLSKHAGETVLVIGHTDTVPYLIKRFGGGSNFNIEDKEFDKLFVVYVFSSGGAHVTELKYGNPS